MNVRSVFGSIRRNARNHGMLPAAYDATVRGLNRFVYYKTLQFLVADEVNERYLELPSHLQFVQLQASDVLAFAQKDEYEIGTNLITRAFRKGDRCYGILDGNTLANYGWFSRKPTLVDNDELLLSFNPQYIYMYKGFTLERYRGQRLHAICKTRALAEYKDLGFKGMLFYAFTNNFNSLKSSYRMGARNCGRIRIVRVGGKYIIRMQPVCPPYRLALQYTG